MVAVADIQYLPRLGRLKTQALTKLRSPAGVRRFCKANIQYIISETLADLL